MNVSRTVEGRRSRTTPMSVSDGAIGSMAERNFERGANFVLTHWKRLSVSRSTAVVLNRILTRGLVDEADRGQPNWRRESVSFYQWLGSPTALELAKDDPVSFAEQVHRSISGLDSFPDGNGRTARLMADLALIKGGRAPAFYTTKDQYFQRGNVRSDAPLAEQAKYFREIAEAGEGAASAPSPASN